MSVGRYAARVLLVLPGPDLLRAAAGAGLDVRAVHDPRLGPPEPLVAAGFPQHHLVTADFSETSALRTLLTDLAVQHSVQHVLCLPSDPASTRAAAAARVAGEVHHALFPDRAAATNRLPDPRTLRRVLTGSGIPVAHPAPAPGHPSPLYAATTLTVDGMHLVADITAAGRGTPCSAAQRAVVRRTVRSLLDLVGFESGATRTELLLHPDGARVVGSRELVHG